KLGEPKTTVWPARDAKRRAAGPRHDELADGAGGGDAADLVGGRLREPECPVRPGHDIRRAAADRQLKLGNHAARGITSADPVGAELNEPEGVVLAGRDAARVAGGGGQGVLADGAGGADAANLVRAGI